MSGGSVADIEVAGCEGEACAAVATARAAGSVPVSRSGVAFLPELLLLAPFMATIPLFVPNLRVMRDVCVNPVAFGDIATSMMVACLLVSLVFTAMAVVRGIEWRGPAHGILVASAAVYVVGQIVMWVAGVAYPQAPVFILWSVGTLMGAAVVPLFVAWSACFALDFRNVLFYGALSCMVSSVAAFVVSVLSPIAAGIVWCLCALVGAAAPVILVMRRPAVDATQADAAGDHAIMVGEDMARRGLASVFTDFVSTLWLPLLGLLVCMCCSCMGETELNGRVVRGEFVGLIVASAPAIALCCVRTKTPIVLLAEKLVAPVLVACGIILGGLPSEGAESLGAHYVFVPMVFISLYALASVMAMRGMSRLLVAGITLSACCVAMLVGSALAFAADSRAGTGPYVRLVTFVYYAVVLLDLAYTTWRLMARGSRDEVDGLPATSRPETFEETIAQRMDELVRDYGLTAREREVCEYLWHGYNSGHIAKALLISGNTARTHIRNIYRKLGVSSREELLALFSSRAGEPAIGHAG